MKLKKPRPNHLATAAMVCTLMATPALSQEAVSSSAGISARGVLAIISDGKQDANTYSSGLLADPGRRDTMTLWTEPFDPSRGPTGRIEAPNSNYSPSGIAVLSRDGRRAYVVETMRRPPGATKLSQLVPSDRLMTYDISDPARPRALEETTVGRQPRSLDLSPDARTVVVLSKDAARPLTFVATKSDGKASTASFQVPGVASGFDEFTFVQWSPKQDAIAVHIPSQNRIIFLRIERSLDGTVEAVRPWGNPVVTNKYPLVGRFTPDGRHYLSSDVNWGPDVRGNSHVQRGVLTLIRVAESVDADARHQVTDLDITGQGAESFAVSPDGQYVVVSNMETTGTLPEDPRHNSLALLTLYRLDAERSQLAKISETRYAGRLPQGILFDAASRYVWVGTNELAEDRSQGGVLVFRLDRLPSPRLVDTGRRLPAPPGVHTLAAALPLSTSD
ncbi:lactonase family protein [Variovorax sp. OV084]|jgi:DNA-binding beta-propeller fold protein YncE|uniref:lactonase family protein n=1 Tax=Variovorax TaxID=34072 RepID=UPI0008C877B8|nr:lactonase family protein [Variovorax sp. OV084]SEU04349.1 Lactonase, 7-bladed beta-propeller [Variovorax sp. OV084]